MLPFNQEIVEIGVALERARRYTQCGGSLASWQPMLEVVVHLLRAIW